MVEGEYVNRVTSNMRDRFTAITDIPNNVVGMAETVIRKTRETKPVQGILEAVKKIGDGTIEFLRKQCEITRRWR
jgi:hypothetical protein